MKNLFLLGACLWALAGRAQAQTAPTDIVVVRIYEGSHITAIITRGEGKSEKQEFDYGITDKALTRTSEGYYKLLSQLYTEGYALQTAIPLGSSIVTLLFVKKH